MKDSNITKSILDTFSNSFKLFICILTAVLIAVSTYAMHTVGGDWKVILVGSVFAVVIIALFITTGIRCGKNILTDKEREDLTVLENLKIIKAINKIAPPSVNIPILLRFIVVIANIVRWAFFWIFLLGVSCALMFNGLSGAFIGMCFLAILWLPLLDDLFFKKSNYVVISFVKFVITVCIFALFTAIHL